MGKKTIKYIEPFKNVFLKCKEILGYSEVKTNKYVHKKAIYDGEIVLINSFKGRAKDKRKLKRLNNRFEELWMSYEDASYYLYRKHYVNKLELCNHIFFWCVLIIFLALTIFVYCNSLQSEEFFQTIFLAGMFVFIGVYYGFCVLINIIKNGVMKTMLKSAKKGKDKVIGKIKKLLMKSPLYDENTSLSFLDEHINSMYENELNESKIIESNQTDNEESSMQLAQDKERVVVSTTSFDENVLSNTEENKNIKEENSSNETFDNMNREFDKDTEVKSTTSFDEDILNKVDEEDPVFDAVNDSFVEQEKNDNDIKEEENHIEENDKSEEEQTIVFEEEVNVENETNETFDIKQEEENETLNEDSENIEETLLATEAVVEEDISNENEQENSVFEDNSNDLEVEKNELEDK